MSLANFFQPTAVAIIGASRDRTKLGRQILDNIIRGGFRGRIYPVNLNGGKIAGLMAYRSLAELPTSARQTLLVIIAIPAPFVLSEITECGRLGLKNIIIISAGFKESDSAGRDRENDLQNLAKKYKLNILGPNCLGLINTQRKLNATFTAANLQPGRLTILSQSGAVGAAVLDWLKERQMGLANFVSLGNKAVIDENAILQYLAQDKNTDFIVAYLENIKNGQRFMSLVSRLARVKPIAVLKAGVNPIGQRLAASHTGALANASSVFEIGLQRAGVVELDSLDKLFSWLTILPSLKSSRVIKKLSTSLSVLTNAGGLAVLAADEIGKQHLILDSNFDILGDADAARYAKNLKAVLARPTVHNLLIILSPQTVTEPLLTAKIIARLAKKYPAKLILTSFVGGPAIHQAQKFLRSQQIPTFTTPEEAIRTFKKLINYKTIIKTLRPYNFPLSSQTNHSLKLINASISPDYLQLASQLKKYHFNVLPTARYQKKKLSQYKYPVVLKAVGPDFLHKTDRGGVVINLKTPTALLSAATKLLQNNRRVFKNSANYLVVQKQHPASLEIILGFKRDPSFGPIMMIGQGGIYTEIFKDVALQISDLNLTEAKQLINKLKIAAFFQGVRGQAKFDITELAQWLVNLARFANSNPTIRECDLNPIFVSPTGLVAADWRILY